MPLSMAKGLKKSPVFNTDFEENAGGRGNSSTSMMAFPDWAFEWDMDFIQGNEAVASSTYMQFVGTFMLCGGRGGLFLFTDPQDNTMSYTNSGMLDVTDGSTTYLAPTGNGSSTQFQLARSIGGLAWDVIQNLNGSITVKVNGSVVTNYSVSSTGVVTFTPTGSPAVAAPPNNATLQWTGNFYFLCRFAADTIDATRVFTTNSGLDQWSVESVKFTSEIV